MAHRTIIAQQFGEPVQIERSAVAALNPGHVLELTAADKLQKHSTAGGNIVPLLVALEDDLQGKEVLEAYAADDIIRGWIPRSGDQVILVLKEGENIAIGDVVESAGAGEVQEHVVDTSDSSTPTTVYGNQIIGTAVEALNLSDSSGADSASRLLKVIVA